MSQCHGGRTFQKEGTACASGLSIPSGLRVIKGVGMADVEGARRRCSERKQRDKRRACSGRAAWGLYGHCQGFAFLQEERKSLSDFEQRHDMICLFKKFLKIGPLWLLLG